MHKTGNSRLVGTETSTPRLAVVRRGEPRAFLTLWAHAEATGAEVIWDRRRGERRVAQDPARPERRRGERRAHPPRTWRTLGFVLAPRQPPVLASSADVASVRARPGGEAERTPSLAPGPQDGTLLPPWQVWLRLSVVAAVAVLLLVATSWVTARSRSAPGDSPAPGGDSTAGLPSYLREVQAQIRARWALGGTADHAGPGVVVRFTIGPDGQIQEARVEHGSGRSGRDHAGLSAVVAASPFAPLPPELRGQALPLQATFPPR